MIELNRDLNRPTVSHETADMMHRHLGTPRLYAFARRYLPINGCDFCHPSRLQDVTVSHTAYTENIALEEGCLIECSKNFHDADVAGLHSPPSAQLPQSHATLTTRALPEVSDCSLQPIPNRCAG